MTYSVGKFCLDWPKTSTLTQVKHHLSLLSDDVDLQDFLLGPKKPREKHFLYAVYNNIWKISQQEALERLREIDRINLEKALAIVDNGMTTLTSRIYSLGNIVSSAIDVLEQDIHVTTRAITAMFYYVVTQGAAVTARWLCALVFY